MKTKQQQYPALAKAIGVPTLYLKREDEHKYGSHKGRSIPLMIKRTVKDGIRRFTISSSGNAALAAIRSVVAHNQNNPNKQITLQVFVGQHIPANKLERLQKELTDNAITLEQVDRPKQRAFQAGQDDDVYLLRQSTDDLALEGYAELATDLLKIDDLAAVFVPTSSGTTAQGVGETFLLKTAPAQIHIVQTTACHPIAAALGATGETTERSIAGAIVDNVAHRKEAVVSVVKQTKGAGWIVSDEEIKAATTLVKETTGINISYNSALSVAGVQKAVANGWTCNGAVVCLICGA